MVVNIIRSSPGMSSPMMYNEHKVERDVATVLAAVNMDGPGEDGIESTFTRYEHMNLRSRNISFHMAINPLEGQDHMSDEDIVRFAGKLMEGLGYGEQPYVVYRHDDTDRVHYHVLSIRTDRYGKKINDYQERWKCFQLVRDLEKEFDYTIGNKDGKRKIASVEHFDRAQGNTIAQMRDLCTKCLQYRFTSFAQFKAVLRRYGLAVDEKTGFSTHLTLQGLDDKGHGCTKRISESALGMDLYRLYSERAMETLGMLDSLAGERHRIASLAASPLAEATNQREFRRMLLEKGVDFRIVRNPRTHRVVDADIVDHVTKCAFRLSELGPELTVDMVRDADETKWEHDRRDEGPDITLGDLLSGLGGKPSKSHEKDPKTDPKKKKTKLKF